MLGSEKLKQALDVRREPAKTRESYGHMLFGQGCLAARRLVEAGSRFVTVFWDEFASPVLAGTRTGNTTPDAQRTDARLRRGFSASLPTLISAACSTTRSSWCSANTGGRRRSARKKVAAGPLSQAYRQCSPARHRSRQSRRKTDSIGGTVADRPISPKDLSHDLSPTRLRPRNHSDDRTTRPVPSSQRPSRAGVAGVNREAPFSLSCRTTVGGFVIHSARCRCHLDAQSTSSGAFLQF